MKKDRRVNDKLQGIINRMDVDDLVDLLELIDHRHLQLAYAACPDEFATVNVYMHIRQACEAAKDVLQMPGIKVGDRRAAINNVLEDLTKHLNLLMRLN
jgi:hypothetical protein